MIFTVRDLGFEIGPFLLEGWWALAARAVCAAVIVFAGAVHFIASGVTVQPTCVLAASNSAITAVPFLSVVMGAPKYRLKHIKSTVSAMSFISFS